MAAIHENKHGCNQRSTTMSKRRRWQPHFCWTIVLLVVMIGHSPPQSSSSSSSITLVAAVPRTITTNPPKNRFDKDEPHKQPPKDFKEIAPKLHGLMSMLQSHPLLLLNAVVRIGIAMGLELVLDGFMKGVVTPAVASTGVGALVAPLIFLIGQALQPIVHSIAFIVFDDKFVMATLHSTGMADQLFQGHKLGFLEGFLTRYVVKSLAASCLGLAGLTTVLPFVGHFLTALLSGWAVAWDYVYVPLSHMGHVGPWQQFWTVVRNFRSFQWFGFWAVLIEEIPFIGPVCHVYNVYNAAFFLESVYLKGGSDDATVDTVDTIGSGSWFGGNNEL